MKNLIILCLIISNTAFAAIFPANTAYEVCFTPGGDCTSAIVNEINKAHKSIYIQAYGFTSAPIARAVVNAKQNGVDVEVILDKSQSKKNKFSAVRYLANHEIPVWIDYQPVIAHNKVMIIDNATVITGSFNFTKAAQENNAENVIIIHSQELAGKYLDNWMQRKAVSSRSHSARRRGNHKSIIDWIPRLRAG